jgi:hypothetical protein
MVAAIMGAEGKRLMYRQPMLKNGDEQQLWGGQK